MGGGDIPNTEAGEPEEAGERPQESTEGSGETHKAGTESLLMLSPH